jgi:uncharacterized HAD superfamily protein
MKIAIIDLDDSIVDFSGHCINTLNTVFGKNLKVNQVTQCIAKSYEIHENQFLQSLVEHQILENAKPLTGAYELLNHLKDKDYAVKIVTARGWHPKGKSLTEDWLKSHNIPYDFLSVVEIKNGAKINLLQSDIRDIKFCLEDNVSHIKDFLENGINVTVPTTPWNYSLIHNNINRISSLHEAIRYVN